MMMANFKYLRVVWGRLVLRGPEGKNWYLWMGGHPKEAYFRSV